MQSLCFYSCKCDRILLELDEGDVDVVETVRPLPGEISLEAWSTFLGKSSVVASLSLHQVSDLSDLLSITIFVIDQVHPHDFITKALILVRWANLVRIDIILVAR